MAVRSATAGVACHHGRGVSPVRPPLPHGHSVGQVGLLAAAGPALPQFGQEPGQAPVAQPGEGANLPGRQTAGGDLQRRGAGEPSAPEDAEDGLPGSQAGVPQQPDCPRFATRPAGGRAIDDGRLPPPGPRTDVENPLSLLQCQFFADNSPVLRRSVAFSPDGRRFVTAAMRDLNRPVIEVKVWDARTGTVKVEMKGSNSLALTSVAFSPDGTRMVAGNFGGFSRDNTATVWDVETGTALLELKGHAGNVFSVAFSPDGQRIVTGSTDRTVRVWDARTGTTLAELKGHTDAVTCVSFSADGTRLLTASGRVGNKPGEVFVWDAPIAKPALELVGHTAPILAATFSPDGTRIATGSRDRTVKVWDPRTGAALLDLNGPTAGVWRLAFSADGTRIVTCDGSTVKVWDAKTGSALLELKGKPGEMEVAAFSPDGTRIVTGGTRWEGKGLPKGAVTVKGVATVWNAATG